MKKIFLIALLFHYVLNIQSEEIIKFSKHELDVNFLFIRNKHLLFGNKPLIIEDKNFENIVFSIDRKFTHRNGLGIQLQYNRLFNRYLYISTSLNFNYYIPSRYYYLNGDLSYNFNLYETANASAFFVDQGVGVIPLNSEKIELRIGTGIGVGHTQYQEVLGPKYYYQDDEGENLIFTGYSKIVEASPMWGGFFENSINYKIIKDKMAEFN